MKIYKHSFYFLFGLLILKMLRNYAVAEAATAASALMKWCFMYL